MEYIRHAYLYTKAVWYYRIEKKQPLLMETVTAVFVYCYKTCQKRLFQLIIEQRSEAFYDSD